jgi:acyl carrier protein
MTKQNFADHLAELLETEEKLTPETNLKEVEEYDSLTILSVIAFIDKTFKKTLSAEQIAKVTTINSLIDCIGQENFA